MEQEYLSIKEFASLAGVSQQAIYKRLANPSDELCRFLIELDGKKRLEVSALDFFIHASNSTGNSTGCSTGCSTVETKLIDLLQEELKQKNEQISNLQKLLHQEQQLHLLTRQELLALTAP
jgi:transcriptional regulator with XRE-family HTH domain